MKMPQFLRPNRTKITAFIIIGGLWVFEIARYGLVVGFEPVRIIGNGLFAIIASYLVIFYLVGRLQRKKI